MHDQLLKQLAADDPDKRMDAVAVLLVHDEEGRDQLLSLAQYHWGKREGLEDVAQEAVYRLLKRVERGPLEVRNLSAFWRYVRKTVKSAAEDLRRREARQPLANSELVDNRPAPPADHPPQATADMLDRAVARAGLTNLEAAVWADYLENGSDGGPRPAQAAAKRLGICLAARNNALARAKAKVAKWVERLKRRRDEDEP